MMTTTPPEKYLVCANGKSRVSRFLLLALTFAVFVGCGGDRGPQRVVVSGSITYNGTPVTEGRIRFVPMAVSDAPVSGAYIVDGRYQVDGRGGVPLGMHKIQIEGYRTSNAGTLPDLTKPGRRNKASSDGQYLPKKFNTDTQLEITIQPGSQNITKDFALTD